MATVAEKKAQIITYIKTNLKLVDPNGTEIPKWEKRINSMDDKQFYAFGKMLKDGKAQFYFQIPNLTKSLNNDNILITAAKVGVKIFDYIWFYDEKLGTHYRSKYKHPIYRVPVRRMQQFLDKKMSVPDSDKKIDMITGQVTAKDASSSITNPEIQALNARGLKHTLDELVTIRGGNIAAYGEFKRQLEEQGSAQMEAVSDGTISRTAMVTEVFLEAMHFDTNLANG